MDKSQRALVPEKGTTNLVGTSVEDFSQTAPINVEDRKLAEFTDDEISTLLRQHDLESLLEQQEA
jgi:hypothetical protein